MKILVAVDFSAATEKVIQQGKRLANAFSAKLLLLHCVDVPPDPTFIAYEPDLLLGGIEPDPASLRDTLAERYRHEHDRLLAMSRSIREAGIDCSALLVQGPSEDVILEVSERHQADMIVLGSHGKGVAARILLGSTSRGVLHKAKVPVHLIPTRD
jgi:nucleotide-binding universal stress UspA family protein